MGQVHAGLIVISAELRTGGAVPQVSAFNLLAATIRILATE